MAGPIIDKIKELAEGQKIDSYVEPFFGGGSICFKLLEQEVFPDLLFVVGNDIDFGLWCLWQTVLKQPEILIHNIHSFIPNVDDFYSFKEILMGRDFKDLSIADIGFMKLAVQQMSYSGLGVKAGGPIGGKKQSSKYGVGCRWSPESMSKKVLKINKLLKQYQGGFLSTDTWILSGAYNNLKTFAYLDPPYYVKGEELYAHSFTVKDHEILSDRLKNANHLWLLSYDDCPEVRELYSWAQIDDINVNYTIRTARTKNELLIYPHTEKSIA